MLATYLNRQKQLDSLLIEHIEHQKNGSEPLHSGSQKDPKLELFCPFYLYTLHCFYTQEALARRSPSRERQDTAPVWPLNAVFTYFPSSQLRSLF